MNDEQLTSYLLDTANADAPGVEALATSLRSYAEKKERKQTMDVAFINKIVAQARACPAAGKLPRNFLHAWQHVKQIADAAWIHLYPAATPNDDDTQDDD